MKKFNEILDFSDNHAANIIAKGFHILNDRWITPDVKFVFCIDTNKKYKVIEFHLLELYVLRPVNQRVPVEALGMNSDLSNWETKKFSCIKVENHEEFKFGYKIHEIHD